MRIQAIVLRLAALLVLLCSACDYCAFDLYNPEASMSRPGPELFSDTDRAFCPSTVRTSDLPDDQCLCCSPSIPPQASILDSPLLTSPALENRPSQPPIPDVPAIERPPRS
jgi:hypothetical protein